MGRPTLSDNEPTVKTSVKMPLSYREVLRTVGDGNASAGLRRLVEAWQHGQVWTDERIGLRVIGKPKPQPTVPDLVREATDAWQELRGRLTKRPADEVYAFAYWLFRYSGLVRS